MCRLSADPARQRHTPSLAGVLFAARAFCSASPNPNRHVTDVKNVDESSGGINTDPSTGTTDLDIHRDFIRSIILEQIQHQGEQDQELDKGGGGEGNNLKEIDGQLITLAHPLLRKYDFNINEFITNATNSIHNLFEQMQESADERAAGGRGRSGIDMSFSSEVSELLEQTCTAPARETLRQVMAGHVALGDIARRKDHDLQWFARFGLQMEHALVVHERHLAFMQLDAITVHVLKSRSPPEESTETADTEAVGEVGGSAEQEEEEEEDDDDDERKHVLAQVTLTYQLRSDATLRYFLPGPPRYDLKVSE